MKSSLTDRERMNIEAIKKMAGESKMPAKKLRTVGTSSLHTFIKTKEQADRFMKSLDANDMKDPIKDTVQIKIDEIQKKTSKNQITARERANIEAIEKKAREGKMPAKVPRPPYSSLHKIIKTKERADRFMKSLRDAN